MKLITIILCLSMLFVGCQPAADNSANEAFEKNSKTVQAYLDGWPNENLDYAAIYSDDFIQRGTGFGEKDSISLNEIMTSDKAIWEKYDFELLSKPVILLPGVNVDTKIPDGSVRYYGDWKVTLPASDSTEEKSGVLKIYESFDFNEEGKIVFAQSYGDFTGLMHYLNGKE